MPEAPSPDWLSWAFWAQDHESVRDLVITVAALVGIPFIIWREWLHHRQTDAALQQARTAQLRHQAQADADRDRRITNNFTRAAELLGSEKLATRLGGIYALERIARESLDDHWPIMETLTAYVRERSATMHYPEGASPTPVDIAAVLTVIGRRRLDHERDMRRLNLTGAYLVDVKPDEPLGREFARASLKGANLTGADLEGANLMAADLTHADLTAARLQGANLEWSHLTHAVLTAARLQGANLKVAELIHADLKHANLLDAKLDMTNLFDANLEGTELRGATFHLTNFDQAILTGANLAGADLSAARMLTQSQLNSAITDENTKMPELMCPGTNCSGG